MSQWRVNWWVVSFRLELLRAFSINILFLLKVHFCRSEDGLQFNIDFKDIIKRMVLEIQDGLFEHLRDETKQNSVLFSADLVI